MNSRNEQEWYEKAMFNIAEARGFKLTDSDKQQLKDVFTAAKTAEKNAAPESESESESESQSNSETPKPDLSAMLHMLDLFDRRLELLGEGKNTKEKQRMATQIPDIALACVIVGTKIGNEESVYVDDIASELPQTHRLRKEHGDNQPRLNAAVSSLEIDLLAKMKWQLEIGGLNSAERENRVNKLVSYADPMDRPGIKKELRELNSDLRIMDQESKNKSVARKLPKESLAPELARAAGKAAIAKDKTQAEDPDSKVKRVRKKAPQGMMFSNSYNDKFTDAKTPRSERKAKSTKKPGM